MSNSIGALWSKYTKTEPVTKYLAGLIEIEGRKHRISIFPNRYKKEDKHPDYRILPSISKEQGQGQSQYQNSNYQPQTSQPTHYENAPTPTQAPPEKVDMTIDQDFDISQIKF